jgi:hypothetical protein
VAPASHLHLPPPLTRRGILSIHDPRGEVFTFNPTDGEICAIGTDVLPCLLEHAWSGNTAILNIGIACPRHGTNCHNATCQHNGKTTHRKCVMLFGWAEINQP